MKNSLGSSLRAPGRTLLLAGGLGFLSLAGVSSPALRADIGINIQIDAPPPPPRHEVIIERDRPGADYIWIDGYWDGSPGHYTWVGGRWDHPPHEHGIWVGPRWERDHDGHYHQVKGGWRDGPRH